MLALQAGVVALPRPTLRSGPLTRVSGRGWALIPLGSIVGVIFAIRYLSDTATGLTYLALVAVPPLAAFALAWGARRPLPSPVAVIGAGALFALAWAARDSLLGEGAAALLSALSCVTLGVLLAAVTPPGWLKVGVVLMAVADAWLVISDLLQSPNAALSAAAPGAGLPRLQSELFGQISLGYGDLFIAAVLGALLAGSGRRQRAGAVLTLALAAVFDLLFLTVSELPATVPVAVALIVIELHDRHRDGRRPSVSGRDRRLRREAVTPRPAR